MLLAILLLQILLLVMFVASRVVDTMTVRRVQRDHERRMADMDEAYGPLPKAREVRSGDPQPLRP